MAEPVYHTLLHLTGPRRGSTEVLEEPQLTLGTEPEADLHFPADQSPEVAPRHAELAREDSGWTLAASPGAAVYVDGTRVDRHRLRPGDVVQLGRDGPLLRYRLQADPGAEYEDLRQVLSDCVACVRHGPDSAAAKAGLLLRLMSREIMGRTSPWTRGGLAATLVLLLVATGYLFVRSRQLTRQLDRDRARIEAVVDTLRARDRRRAVTPAALDSLRELVAERAADRPSTDARRVVAGASRSVVFIQGAYGFQDPETGRAVRLRKQGTPEGPGRLSPKRVGAGPEAGGTPVERHYTGTGFVVTGRGHVVTNRHLVRPWRQDRLAGQLKRLGYLPVMRKLVGYLPGRKEPVDLHLVASSGSADLTLLKPAEVPAETEPLPLAEDAPQPGDEVFVLGYPAGILALLARSDPTVLDSLRADPGTDFWSAARRLARDGHIEPLTTRGIVGQVTPSAVAYDAETTQGGSGGPVLDAAGRVVAVNRATVADFQGSNLGVPASEVRKLLGEALERGSSRR